MKSINEDELNSENTFFHFSPAAAHSSVAENGLEAKIGPNANGIEYTKKVFFSKGELGLLQMQEVWIKWEMNRMFRSNETWNRQFLQRHYLNDNEKKRDVFNKFYNDMKNRVYYKLNLEEGKDFSYDDIDEAKIDAIKNKEERAEVKEKTGINLLPYHYLYMVEFFFPFGNIDDKRVELCNMHTFVNKGVEPQNISLVKVYEKDDDKEVEKNDALSVMMHVYEKNRDKVSEYDLLNEFVEYAKLRQRVEKEQGLNSNNKVVDEVKTEQDVMDRMNEKVRFFHNQKDNDREER